MDPITALALGSLFLEAGATLYDRAKANGATPEQIAEHRARARARLNASALALEAAEPPAPGTGA